MHGAEPARVSMQTQTIEWHKGNSSQQQTPTHTHICNVGDVVKPRPWWHYLSSTTPVPTVHWCETTSSSGGRYSMWHGEGQGFTEHICWWNKHRGERRIPGPKPRGFTPHSPALSTFCRSAGTEPPNSTRRSRQPAKAHTSAHAPLFLLIVLKA